MEARPEQKRPIASWNSQAGPAKVFFLNDCQRRPNAPVVADNLVLPSEQIFRDNFFGFAKRLTWQDAPAEVREKIRPAGCATQEPYWMWLAGFSNGHRHRAKGEPS
jgi:hypothetical protein